jgi:protein required for attachment to host cells
MGEKMERIWILVADSARAHLYLRGNRWDQLDPLEKHEHPEGRAHEGDLVSDQGTAVIQRGGQGQRRSSQPEVSATEHEAQVFAHELAGRLRKGRVEREMDSLVLVAAPHFLGLLREALDDQTRKCVVHEIDKDLTQYDTDKIGELLDKHLST